MVHHFATDSWIRFNWRTVVDASRVHRTSWWSTWSLYSSWVLVINWRFFILLSYLCNRSNCYKFRLWQRARIVVYFSSTYRILHRWSSTIICFGIIEKVVAVRLAKTLGETQSCFRVLGQRMWWRPSCIALSVASSIPSHSLRHIAYHGDGLPILSMFSLQLLPVVHKEILLWSGGWWLIGISWWYFFHHFFLIKHF